MTAARASRSATRRAWRRVAARTLSGAERCVVRSGGGRRRRRGRGGGAPVDGPADAPGVRSRTGPGPRRPARGSRPRCGRWWLGGPAHLHVGQLPASPVLEGMGPGHGRPLGAVDGDGVAVGQVGGVEVVAGEALVAAVGHGGGQLSALDVDGEHGARLRGDDLAVGPRGQGDDAVAGPVAGLADGQLLAGRGGPCCLPGQAAPAVELGHVGPPPGVHGRIGAVRRRRSPSRPRCRPGPRPDPADTEMRPLAA